MLLLFARTLSAQFPANALTTTQTSNLFTSTLTMTPSTTEFHQLLICLILLRHQQTTAHSECTLTLIILLSTPSESPSSQTTILSLIKTLKEQDLDQQWAQPQKFFMLRHLHQRLLHQRLLLPPLMSHSGASLLSLCLAVFQSSHSWQLQSQFSKEKIATTNSTKNGKPIEELTSDGDDHYDIRGCFLLVLLVQFHFIIFQQTINHPKFLNVLH